MDRHPAADDTSAQSAGLADFSGVSYHQRKYGQTDDSLESFRSPAIPLPTGPDNPHIRDSGGIKTQSESDLMQGVKPSRAGFKQESQDAKVPVKQESDDNNSLSRYATSSEGARTEFKFVIFEPGQGPDADDAVSDEGTEQSGDEDYMYYEEESDMEGDEEDEGEEPVAAQDCGYHAKGWGNDLLKRIFTNDTTPPHILREAFRKSTELTQKSEDDLHSSKPFHPTLPCHETLLLAELLLYTSPDAHALRALGLRSYSHSASLEMTTEADAEVVGTPVTLHDPKQVFQAITKLGRPNRHFPAHSMWCGTQLGEDEDTAKDWNRPFNQDRLKSQDDVLEWDLGTHDGVVYGNEQIDLNLVLRARSDRGFVPPWDL